MDFALLIASYASRQAGRKISQQQMLYEALRDAIRSGEFSPGMRLLPSRVLAQELKIARNSVLYAYERLGEEGFVLTRRQGSIIAANTKQVTGIRGVDRDSPPVRASTALLPGMPALDRFPIATWRRAIDRAWRRAGPAELGYMDNEGHPALRRAIADYLKVSRGVRCEVSQVFITDGTQTSLDVCTGTLLAPGKTVWFENPGYAGARAAFRHAGLSIVPMPVDIDGMVTEPLQWTQTPPDLVYLSPSHQYPLGSVLSLDRRIALLEKAREHGSWIVEDDYDSEFRHDGPPLPALQGLEAETPVIYMGTFSKTLFPALKISFMVVPVSLVSRIGRTLAAIRRQGRIVDQMALADFIDSGAYARHLRAMKLLYTQRRRALLAALRTQLSRYLTISGGAGGMHLTVRLDAPLRDTDVAEASAARGLYLSALSEYCDPPDRHFNGFVLGYANLPVSEAALRVGQLTELITGLLAKTAQSAT